MSKKRKEDYVKVLKSIKRFIRRELGRPVQVTHVMSDFEAAVWGAFREVFPQVELQGCLFHWTQCVFKKCHALRLQQAYITDPAVHKFVRRLLALPLLPKEHIVPVFNALSPRCPEGPLSTLCTYIRGKWMREQGCFPPSSWCAYRQATRTNNDAEGYHHRLNRRANDHGHGFYVLIQLLHREATYVDLQCRLISEEALTRINRKKYTRMQTNLEKTWNDYQAKNISALELLKKCAYIYAPTIDLVNYDHQ
jgi:hypothetical protein